MARTYVPGYGYVDSDDPGTRGSVKPGAKPLVTGQEAPEKPREFNRVSIVPRTIDIDFGTNLDPIEAPRALGGAALTPELRSQLIDQTPNDAVFTDAQYAQRVATQRGGYVRINDDGTYQVLYGGSAAAAKRADEATGEGFETTDRDRAQEIADVRDGWVVETSPGVFEVRYGAKDQKDGFTGSKDATNNSTPSNYRNLPGTEGYDTVDARLNQREYSIVHRSQSQRDLPEWQTMSIDEFEERRNKREAMTYEVYTGTFGSAGTTGSTSTDTFTDARLMKDLMLNDAEYDRVIEMTRRYYKGMPMTFSWIEKRWGKAVDMANKRWVLFGEKITPYEVYDRMIARYRAKQDERNASGGGGYGSYGGGGGGGGSVTIRLTNATDARVILNQAMTQWMGREAKPEEIAKFVKMLNSQERANPIEVSSDGTTTVQKGGFNPATFAQDFVQAKNGSAEYTAVTSILDALIGALDGDTGVL